MKARFSLLARTRPWRRQALARLGVACGLLLLIPALASAQVGSFLQAPVQTGGGSVPPNLMFTLDDSGSMFFECIPEELCTPNAYSLESIPSRKLISKANRKGVWIYDDVPLMRATSVDGAGNPVAPTTYWNTSSFTKADPRRVRSSATNPLYYNPTIEYKPWLKADGTRLSNSNPVQAPVLGSLPEGAVYTMPTQNLTGTVRVAEIKKSATEWDNGFCRYIRPAQSCADPLNYGVLLYQDAVIARYYNLRATATGPLPLGENKDDFELVKIEAGNTYPKAATRNDCSGATCSYNEEIQNFANWYTYHRNRALAAIAGTAEAMASLPAEYRLGYGRINRTKSGPSDKIDGIDNPGTLVKGVRPFSSTERSAFYTWLFGRTNPAGSTPLRNAMHNVGQYFMRSDNQSPWAFNPEQGDPQGTKSSECRRAIHIMMTDGYWNNGSSIQTVDAEIPITNVDNNAGPNIGGPGGQTYQYVPSAPYMDIYPTPADVNATGQTAYKNTLADIALYYWYQDLRSDLDNLLKPIKKLGRENPAFWQHLTTYGIAFGVDGTLKNPEDLPALISGAKTWGNPKPSSSGTSGNPAGIDDLWHATINSRGLLLSAKNSTEYTTALTSIIDDVTTASSGSESGVSVSTNLLPSVGTTNRKYTPMFGAGWSGDVIAENINERGEPQNTAWAAAAKLTQTTANGRRIFSYDPVAKAGVQFYASVGLTAAMKTDIGTAQGLSNADLINFIRGDRSKEGVGANKFRKRTSDTSDGANSKPVLGDIVNSTPVLVADLLNAFYSFLPIKNSIGTIDWGRESYSRFLAAKKLRTGHLAVGANDGMMHMFSESGQIPAQVTDGNEAFAYVPNAVLKSLKTLADPDYNHIYFVDGPLTEADVYDKTNTRWKNIVIGTSGAGMRATPGPGTYDVPFIYAINMPVPTWASGSNPPAALTTAQSAPGSSDVMWEISRDTICSDGTQCFSGMGHVITRPEVGVLRDGRWVVIFGSGYRDQDINLTDLMPKLYIVDALTGNLIKRIDTGFISSGGGRNGLGGVGVVRDGQMRIVAAYGGDLYGNLWKFDLTSDNPNSWGMAFFDSSASPAKAWPLFTATNSNGDPEPIIAKPTFRAMPGGGVIVLFGTGQLHAVGDVANTDERTLYGVTDTLTVGLASPAAARVVAGKAALVPQLNGNASPSVIAGSVGTTYRKFTVMPVDYSTKRGWYLPLRIGAGERLINEPQIRFDGVLMQTVRPLSSSTDCTGSKVARQGYLLDPFMSGAARLPFDGDANGTPDSNIVEIQGTGDNLLVMRAPKCTGPHCSGSTPTPPCTGPACNRMQCPKTGVIMGAGSGGVEACFGSDAIRRQWRQLVSPPQ